MASQLTIAERSRIALLSAERTRRRFLSRVLSSRLVRWRYGAPVADNLLIVPPVLRTADPSFYREIQLGQFGLAGTIAILDGHSPFDIVPPNAAWERSLNGFGWLRHLDAAGHEGARDTARQLALEWTIRHGNGAGIAGEPAVTARRIISWLSHAGLLLDGAEPKSYAALAGSLGTDLVRLSAGWRDAPAGYPRLLSLTALLLADLSIAGHDRQLADTQGIFSSELNRQILSDGGHISRNAGVLVELLLDLLPLRQCFAARSIEPPARLAPAMQRMLTLLRMQRLGDGMLARFNGVSVGVPAGLATVLAYDDRQAVLPVLAPQSGCARLERGRTVIVMDAGAPPPLAQAGQAHAGCLSFEMSAGTELVFVNGGAPGPADAEWRDAARSTASHNTLCLAGRSSSKLVRHRLLEQLTGGPPLRGPRVVRAKAEEHGGSLELEAQHNGYVETFGLMHVRTLSLAVNGKRLVGIDRLQPPHGRHAARDELPFAIHFHLHPDAACRAGGKAGSALVKLRNGEPWLFSAEGAALSIEDSTYFVDSAGPRRSLQIVLRGTVSGEASVRWIAECGA